MDNKPSMFDFSLDDLTQYSSSLVYQPVGGGSGITSINNAITDNLYGINHRQTPSPIPTNRDHYGLTFFTRPQLNLQKDNLRNSRKFFRLMTSNERSYQAAIRAYLDPRLHVGWGGSNAVECALVDPQQVFIPILTNHLVAISGWRDTVVPTFTSSEGAYKEAWSMADGMTDDFSVFDISATFRNSIGDPITQLFQTWCDYQSLVFEGLNFNPYPDYLLSNEIDYNTRIYRLVLDKTKTYVQRIYAVGAAFPISNPIGSMADYAIDKPYNDANAEITIQFRCMGSIYNDERLIHDFNAAVGIFHESFQDQVPNKDAKSDSGMYAGYGGIPESSGMVKIKPELLSLFNNRGYPQINPYTYELEWYISLDYMNAKLNQYLNVHDSLTQTSIAEEPIAI